MTDYSESIAIVYRVKFDTEWLRHRPFPEDAHSTIIYLGQIPDVNFAKEDVLSAIADLELYFYMSCDVTGVEMFGPDEDVPVLLLSKNDVLAKTHADVTDALAAVEIESASAFSEYRPHVTVDLEGYNDPPDSVLICPAELWWGDEVHSLATITHYEGGHHGT